MGLEIAQREREAVVDADQRWGILGQAFQQPLCDTLPRPVFARAGWWLNFEGLRATISAIDAETLEAGGGRFRARIVNANVPRER